MLAADGRGPARLLPSTSQAVGCRGHDPGKGGPAVAPDNDLQLVEAVCFLVFLLRLWPVGGIQKLPPRGTGRAGHASRGQAWRPRLHPSRPPSSCLSPRLRLRENRLSDLPWLGPRPWRCSLRQSSCGSGLPHQVWITRHLGVRGLSSQPC